MSNPNRGQPSLTLRERDMDKHRFTGSVEHSHHLLRCSACGEDLLDVVVIKPWVDAKLRYRADCPHCGDHSFPTGVITGEVIIGTTADPARTVYSGAEEKGDTIHLRTAKGPAA
jgi:hypothetical protein